MIDIKSMTLPEIEAAFQEQSLPKFRAGQVYKWLHRGVLSFDEMSDLSKDLRGKLAGRYAIACAKVERRQVSAVDGTVKYLFSFADGAAVEAVLMSYHHGYSLCISTQVGCRMGCTFCATGKSGYERDLLPSEMLAQVQAAERDAGVRISNIVLMGMGEPLDNFANVLRFLELISSEDGMNIGMRHISLSTCGLADKIRELADKKLQLTLSVSLHAPNDEIRTQTMPVNRRWNVEQLLDACRYYANTTHRRISFEYAMIAGVNDTDACALELASRLKGMLCHVNLIPVNTVEGSSYRKSGRIEKFSELLSNRGITTTVRRTLGSDIDASCGQLRRRVLGEKNTAGEQP